jgi:hypothetical protein
MASTTPESTADFPRGSTRPRTPGPVGKTRQNAHRSARTGRSSVRREPHGKRVGAGQRSERPVRRGADNSDGGVRSTHRGRAGSAHRSPASRRPGLDQLQRDFFDDRRQERRAATDNDRIAEHAQLVDQAEPDRRRCQARAADRDILVGRVQRRSDSSATDASASRALP